MAMRSPRLRLLIVCLVALALLAAGGLWAVIGPVDRSPSTDHSALDVGSTPATSTLASAPTTTEVGKNLGANDPAAAASAPRIDPQVEAAVATTGRASG